MEKDFKDYRDDQEILEELAKRAADGDATAKQLNYSDDCNWLIGKLIAESEAQNDNLLNSLNLDCVQEPVDLRNISAVLKILSSYAAAKAAAMELRVAGRINDALEFERDTQVLFHRLPEWARWR